MTEPTAAAELILRQAARLALAAPSVFNTQPWRWRIAGDTLRLWADRTRQLGTVDSGGRLLTISCGVALHHAIVALAAAGYEARVERLPDTGEPDLLAEVGIAGPHRVGDADVGLRRAIALRRTDRRAFTRMPVPSEVVESLVAACEEQGARMHVLAWHEVPVLALAAVRAGALQLSNPDYRAELADWTHRPPWSGDGVPLSTAVEAAPRRVPVRDFTPFGGASLPAGLDSDSGAVYGVVHTSGDGPQDWLAAGMGLSAVLLNATAAELGTAPISEVTEEPAARQDMRTVVPEGHPQVGVRIGHSPPGRPPWTPRRLPEEAVTKA